jgi:hypothetical protein
MPAGAVSVTRPGKWGNPFVVGDGTSTFHCPTVAETVAAYRNMLPHTFLARDLPELRGKDLACWCPVGSPCHADVLLEIANS